MDTRASVDNVDPLQVDALQCLVNCGSEQDQNEQVVPKNDRYDHANAAVPLAVAPSQHCFHGATDRRTVTMDGAALYVLAM
jgi:hypothetical protein